MQNSIMRNSILGVILASGFSKRMGQNKLLLHYKNMPISEHVIKACKDSNLSSVVIVSRFSEIFKLSEKYDILYEENKNADLGQSESIKLSLKYLSDHDGIMFFSADTPFITSDIINHMIAHFNDEILALEYDGNITNPVIFPKRYKDDLYALKGDTGGKSILKSNKFDKINIGFNNKDIDTLEDFLSIEVK